MRTVCTNPMLHNTHKISEKKLKKNKQESYYSRIIPNLLTLPVYFSGFCFGTNDCQRQWKEKKIVKHMTTLLTKLAK